MASPTASVRDKFVAEFGTFFAGCTTMIPRRSWFMYKECQVYIRVMMLEGRPWFCLASIEVYGKHKRQGLFNFVLNHLEQLAEQKQGRVTIESIQNHLVEEAAQRRGYTIKDPTIMCPSYYKNFGGYTL
jgi:hypothetical protein